MEIKAFQDYYPDELSQCYGCGRLNSKGLQIKSYWDGEESFTIYEAMPYHTAVSGYVYGGLIASLIDCHSTATASAAAYRAAGRPMGTKPYYRFVTASLHVDYNHPTPIDAQLCVRGIIKEMKERKVVVSSTLTANGEICVRGEVVAVQIPENMISGNS